MCANVKTCRDNLGPAETPAGRGLLVVSFGTSHRQTCDETIGAIEAALAKAIPDRALYRAWTSGRIIRRLRERDGVCIDTMEEALERMASDGIADVLAVPTHMIAGAEYDKVLTALTEKRDRFRQLAVSRPLLDSPSDLQALSGILVREHLPAGALVLMGHGSAERREANEVYVQLEEAFRERGCENAFVGTVEGEPCLAEVLGKLDCRSREQGNPRPDRPVILAPLMIVAGDHALKDMTGAEPASWQNRLTAAGWTVRPVLRGLGAYRGVQDMFIEHARNAGALG